MRSLLRLGAALSVAACMLAPSIARAQDAWYDPGYYDPGWYDDSWWIYDPMYCWAVPSRQECGLPASDPYWSTACGYEELARQASDPTTSTCAAYAAQDAAAYPIGSAVVPRETRRADGQVDAEAGSIQPTSIMPYDHAGLNAWGGTTTYAGLAMGDKAYVAAPQGGSWWWWDPVSWKRFLWSMNESTAAHVESCEEYVHEKYYGYSVVEDQMNLGKDNYRAAFSAALQPGGLLRVSAVQSRSGGTSVPMPWNANAQPQNDFFRGEYAYPPNPCTEHVMAADLRAKLDAGRVGLAHGSFFHSFIGQVVSMYWDDSYLAAMGVKQADFLELLGERAAVYDRWLAYSGAQAMSAASCDAAVDVATVPYDPFATVIDPIFDHTIDTTSPSTMTVSGSVAYLTTYSYPMSWTDTSAADAPTSTLAPDLGDEGDGTIAPAPDLDWAVYYPDGLPTVRRYDCAALAELQAGRQDAADAVATRLVEIDQRIEAALREAESLGCLESGTITPCDWSPSLFVREVQGTFVDGRERDFRECMLYTADDFVSAQAPIAHADQYGAPQFFPISDYRGSTESVTAFFRARDAYRQHLMEKYQVAKVTWDAGDLPRPAGAPAPTGIGRRMADRGQLGSSLFGAEYGYEAGWSLTDYERHFCHANLHGVGKADGLVRIFGTTKDVFAVDARFDTYEKGTQQYGEWGNQAGGWIARAESGGERGYRAKLKMRLFGSDIVNVTDDRVLIGPTTERKSFRLAKTWSDTITFLDLQQRFFVGPVPVLVTAGASGSFGIELAARADFEATCPELTINATGTAAPFASLDAQAAAAVDLGIASAGIQVNLTLLKISLPLDLKLSLHGVISNSGTASLALHVAPRLGLRLTVLAGQIKAFVKVVFAKFYLPLVSWDGIRLEQTLFDKEITVDLSVFK